MARVSNGLLLWWGCRMSIELRDQIAIAAMNSFASKVDRESELKWVAKMSYKMADAMLEARAKVNPDTGKNDQQ